MESLGVDIRYNTEVTKLLLEEREIPETVLPVEVKESDGVFFFTIRRKGGEST